jgi:hypothetical protein
MSGPVSSPRPIFGVKIGPEVNIFAKKFSKNGAQKLRSML